MLRFFINNRINDETILFEQLIKIYLKVYHVKKQKNVDGLKYWWWCAIKNSTGI
jgi:hypothetical protein